MSSFLPGVLVKCEHGPSQTKLFLFIAVGFSKSEKEYNGQQRGSILQWGSPALSRYCWSTRVELGWVFPGFVSCEVKWKRLNKGAASKGQRRSCCLAQLTMPMNILIKYPTLVWGTELLSKDRTLNSSSAAKWCHWHTFQALWLEQQVPVCSRRTSPHSPGTVGGLNELFLSDSLKISSSFGPSKSLNWLYK